MKRTHATSRRCARRLARVAFVALVTTCALGGVACTVHTRLIDASVDDKLDGVCAAGCEADVDCLRDGVAVGYRCVEHVCVAEVGACVSTGDCIAAMISREQPCLRESDCHGEEPQRCIDVDQAHASARQGMCADDARNGCESGFNHFTLVDTGGSSFDVCVPAPVTVGGDPGQYVCGASGTCTVEHHQCQDTTDCFAGTKCDTTNAVCVQCLVDADCTDGASACIDHRCGCAGDDECPRPAEPFCERATGRCQACLVDDDCGAHRRCVTAGRTDNVCGCADATACGVAGQAPSLCTPEGVCACAEDSECAAAGGGLCRAGACGRCAASADCADVPTDLDGHPICVAP